ncbi:MAG: hypothetical protein ABJE95_02225 [Byssovorax sp.]
MTTSSIARLGAALATGSLLLLACGGGPATGTTGGGGSGGVGTAASSGSTGGSLPVLPLPQQLPRIVSSGGPTLTTPVVQAVFFAGESPAKMALLDDFFHKLAGSAYWAATTSEYGVGPLTVAPAVTLAEKALDVVHDAGIRGWLADAITTKKLPPPIPGEVYLLYYPSGITVIDDAGGVGCKDYGGYHTDMVVNSQVIAFAVMPHCDSYSAHLAPGDVVAGDAMTTGLTSHELIEAVTDPELSNGPAYQTIDDAHVAWQQYLIGGETGDSCEQQPGIFSLDPGLGYTVQRTWSNAAAAAGHDPCVPEGAPYIGAFPRVPLLDVLGTGRLAVLVPLDHTVTIPLDFVGEDPAGPAWTVKAIDHSTLWGGPKQLELSIDKTTGKHGDVAMLTIHAVALDPHGRAGFLIESQLGSKRTRVPGLVVSF